MRLLHLTRMLPLSLLLASLSAAAQTSSNALESVPGPTQEAISRICLPVQFREGAGAYRNCVQAELNLRRGGNESAMAKLSFDDKYAVQQACAKAGGQSSTLYKTCVSEQIGELNSVATPALDKLSEDELYVVQQSCFEAQSKQGAANYRKCLNGEIQSLLSIPAADTSNLNMLNKNALQLRCSSNSSNAVQYRKCVAAEFESIAGTAPSFLPVSTAAKIANPTTTNNRTSVVSETLASVAQQQTQAVEPTSVGDAAEPASTTVMALPRNITPPTKDTVIVQDAEVKEVASEALALDAAQPVEQNVQSSKNTLRDITGDPITTTTKTPVNTVSTADARVISRPDLVETLELQERANAQGIELEPNANTDTPPPEAPASSDSALSNKLNAWWQKSLDMLASLDGIGWLLLAAVLALPALVLGLVSLIKRLRTPEPPMPSNVALTERIEPGMQTRRMRHEQDVAELFAEESPVEHDAVTRIAMKEHRSEPAQQDHPQTEPEPFAPAAEELAHSPKEFEQDASMSPNNATELAALDENSGTLSAVNIAETESASNEPVTNPAVEEGTWQSGFGHWLAQRPSADRMEVCIEFLIYWVAYGDDRYQPELKTRLFTATNLSSHDQIKRWVLKQDPLAFADVIGWLRGNATQKQLDQIIALIMALLITEHSVSPVQNTLLRFLGDAFNVDRSKLEQRFEKAFGHPLPPIPRTDKYAWWAKQDAIAVQRWDSRTMATRPETEQMVTRLGLQANYNEAHVINAFRRAARRCHPDRFTELGERERALAEQQYTKFEQARDKLLGVSV